MLSPIVNNIITALTYYADSYKEELISGHSNGEIVVYDINTQMILKHINTNCQELA